MKGKALKIICVGKLKASYWKEATEHYLHQLSRWRKIEYIEVRDGDSSQDTQKRILHEGKNIKAALANGDLPCTLDERGRQMNSREFAAFIAQCDMREPRKIAFIIGGPYGLDKAISQTGCQIALSAMTWPHELARVLLLEQLFRAESILHNFPYHND